jgi:1-acyl-sn-glycerol-3-phosphate acyltransferase
MSAEADAPPTPRPAPTLARKLRAVWRVARAVLHLLWGALLVGTTFGRADAAARARHTRRWSAAFLRLLGVRLQAQGTPRPGAKLLAVNHVSWLDIMAIDAVVPARFVSKSEVRHWPVFGRIATGIGTLYIERARPRDAMRVMHQMAAALRAGETLAVFPEGTTSDGHSLLPFHANLLQGAISTATPVQPIALRYSDAIHAISPAVRFLEETMAQSLWSVACAQGLTVNVQILPAQSVAHADRRLLAERLRSEIETALAQWPGRANGPARSQVGS